MTPLLEELAQLQAQALREVRAGTGPADLEALRVRYLGRKGSLKTYLQRTSTLPAAERPRFGQAVNHARQELLAALAERKQALGQEQRERRLHSQCIDVTLPGRSQSGGGRHPVSQVLERITELFCGIGFEVVTGPELEDEYHNFEALNMPSGHPARTMHDTFFARSGKLLRTHTSSVQVRVMHRRPPPLYIISPGRVYRRDHDMTHSPMFHQVEGLMVDEQVSFANLKGLLAEFLRCFFPEPPRLRFRPSYFPFTEPSAEVDVFRGGSWMEVLGCGSVHPRVLEFCGIDSQRYQGLAFGMGVERLAMLYYGIDDLRCFFENDLRFLEQFNQEPG